MNSRRSSLFRIAVLSGMAVLLAVAATLQYQWATQLSAETEVRLGSSLQSLMNRWHRDLYDELSGICIAMQVGPDSGAHDGWNDYLQRYADWNRDRAQSDLVNTANADAPDLVRTLYEWHTSGPGRPELLLLNPDAKTLDPVSVPQELQTLLARLRENSSSLDQAMHAWELPNASNDAHSSTSARTAASRSNALAGWQLDDRVPALVHPVVHHADSFSSLTPIDTPAVDWFVIVLDSDVIRNRILPDLANRYFGGPDGLEYRLAVVASGSQPQAIYSSEPSLRIDDAGSFDSTMNIFGTWPNNPPSESHDPAQHNRNAQEQDWRRFSAPVWFPVIQYSSVSEPWLLLVRHRTGPVGKIARSAWHWNLTIAGIVLLLLAANMGLIVFSSHRAQKLAKLQLMFVASVSHELLSPLSAMYCTGQNAKDGLVQSKSDIITHGSIITSQARQLIDLVKQNLLFAATESGTKGFTRQPLEVSEILASVRKDVAFLLEESGATVDWKIQPGLPSIMGDLSALSQCLQNLIVNAIKYSGKNRWIGVSAALHETEHFSKEIRISVQDHGPGIEPSELRHIFEAFYRSPKVVDAQIHGTGLGLTVAERIAKAMDGRLSVNSEVGIGSTFTLHLPVRKIAAEAPASSSPAMIGNRT